MSTQEIDGKLVLITAQPGSGKSLRAMHYVRQFRKEGRRVVGNVNGADPELMEELQGEWFEEPAGTVVVLDEAQQIFRPASPHAALPDRISKLETHRHQGITLIVITQHPKFIHHNVRRLASRHEHLSRKSSATVVTIHWLDRAIDIEDGAELWQAHRDVWKYDKSLYDTYKSAEIHTRRGAIPRAAKVGGVIAGGGALVLVFLAVNFYTGFVDRAEADEPEQTEAEAVAAEAVAAIERQRTARAVSGLMKSDESRCWLFDDTYTRLQVHPATCLDAMTQGLPQRVPLL